MKTAVVLIAVLVLSLVLPSLDASGALPVRAAVGQEDPIVPSAPTPGAGNDAVENAEAVPPTEPVAPGSSTPEAVNEEENGEAVIPAGQEELLAQMLGQGATLPGQCTFDGGQINRTVIRSTYKCPDGEVVLELRHSSKAEKGSTQTSKFAILSQSGSPPEGLVDAVASLIRSQEAAFEWKVTKWSPLEQSSPVIVPLTVAGVLGSGLLAWALYRRRRPKGKP